MIWKECRNKVREFCDLTSGVSESEEQSIKDKLLSEEKDLVLIAPNE